MHGQIAGEDVAEVARRHAERHFAFATVVEGEARVEVVDDLRQQPRPVHRVDGAEPIGVLELQVIEDLLPLL